MMQVELAQVKSPYHFTISTETSIASISITVKDTDEQLSLPDSSRLIFGRCDPMIEVDVDLTPHGGYHKGVSRRHAQIQKTLRGIFITDLGSRYGTYINGRKLSAYTPQMLCHGDTIILGTLQLVVKQYH